MPKKNTKNTNKLVKYTQDGSQRNKKIIKTSIIYKNKYNYVAYLKKK